MGEQVEKRFTWILKKFSTLQDECYYSRPFTFAGWNWHIIAYPKVKSEGYGHYKHMSLYLGLVDPGSLPSGWRREVKFRLTLVKKIWKGESKVLEGQDWFDASNHAWGFKEFVPVYTVRCRDEGFLVGDKLTIVAQLHLFPLIVKPVETVKVIEQPLSSKEGNQTENDASARNSSQGDSSCQVEQETENDVSQENLDYDVSRKDPCDNASHENLADDDASEEGLDNDDPSEEGSDNDDASEEDRDDGGSDKSPLKDESLKAGNCGTRCNNVASETEVSNVDNDDAPREDPDGDDAFEDDQGDESDDDASSPASSDNDGGVSSQTVENGDTVCNKLESVNGFQPVTEIMDVNGFQVFSSQVDSVRHIFKRHPDIALGFRPKNQQIRKAYMDALLSLIEKLCQSPEKLSEDDLSNADDTLVDLIDVGFKLDWLKTKLIEVSKKKKTEQSCGDRIQTMEEQLQKLKLMFLDLETQLLKEKAEALAARAPLTFNDIVC